MTWTLVRAEELATAAHAATGAVDPGSGQPYVTHPLRVARAVADAGYDEAHQRVALLHDTLEDTALTAADLRAEGAPEQEVRAVLAVTKVPGDGDYAARVRRAAADPLGGVVKGFDMLDNSDPQRSELLRAVDPARAERLAAKYAEGLALLDQLRPGWRRAG